MELDALEIEQLADEIVRGTTNLDDDVPFDESWSDDTGEQQPQRRPHKKPRKTTPGAAKTTTTKNAKPKKKKKYPSGKHMINREAMLPPWTNFRMADVIIPARGSPMYTGTDEMFITYEMQNSYDIFHDPNTQRAMIPLRKLGKAWILMIHTLGPTWNPVANLMAEPDNPLRDRIDPSFLLIPEIQLSKDLLQQEPGKDSPHHTGPTDRGMPQATPWRRITCNFSEMYCDMMNPAYRTPPLVVKKDGLFTTVTLQDCKVAEVNRTTKAVSRLLLKWMMSLVELEHVEGGPRKEERNRYFFRMPIVLDARLSNARPAIVSPTDGILQTDQMSIQFEMIQASKSRDILVIKRMTWKFPNKGALVGISTQRSPISFASTIPQRIFHCERQRFAVDKRLMEEANKEDHPDHPWESKVGIRCRYIVLVKVADERTRQRLAESIFPQPQQQQQRRPVAWVDPETLFGCTCVIYEDPSMVVTGNNSMLADCVPGGSAEVRTMYRSPTEDFRIRTVSKSMPRTTKVPPIPMAQIEAVVECFYYGSLAATTPTPFYWRMRTNVAGMCSRSRGLAVHSEKVATLLRETMPANTLRRQGPPSSERKRKHTSNDEPNHYATESAFLDAGSCWLTSHARSYARSYIDVMRRCYEKKNVGRPNGGEGDGDDDDVRTLLTRFHDPLHPCAFFSVAEIDHASPEWQGGSRISNRHSLVSPVPEIFRLHQPLKHLGSVPLDEPTAAMNKNVTAMIAEADSALRHSIPSPDPPILWFLEVNISQDAGVAVLTLEGQTLAVDQTTLANGKIADCIIRRLQPHSTATTFSAHAWYYGNIADPDRFFKRMGAAWDFREKIDQKDNNNHRKNKSEKKRRETLAAITTDRKEKGDDDDGDSIYEEDEEAVPKNPDQGPSPTPPPPPGIPPPPPPLKRSRETAYTGTNTETMESMKGSIPGVIMRVETDDGKTLELVLSHVGLSRNSDFGKTHVAMRNTMREKRDEIAVTGDLVLGLCSADSARFAQAIINDDPYLAWATYTDVLQDDTTSVGEGGTRSANFVSGFATAKFILDAFRLGDMLASEKVSAAAMAALVIHCDPVLHPPSPASEYPRWVKWCPCTKFYEASVLSKKFVAPNTRIGHLHAENTPVCLAVMLARACDLSPDGETRSGPACDFGLDFVYDYLAAMVGSTEAELSSWVFYEDLKNATGPFEGIPASAVKNFFDLMTAASASRAKAATGSNFDHNTLACKDKHCRKRAKEHRREFVAMGGNTNRKRKYPSDTEEIARLAASDSSDSGKSSESSDGSSSDN